MENTKERIKVELSAKTIAQLIVALHFQGKNEKLAWIKDVDGILHLKRKNLHIIVNIGNRKEQYSQEQILNQVIIKTDQIEAEYNCEELYKKLRGTPCMDVLENFIDSLRRIESEDNEMAHDILAMFNETPEKDRFQYLQ